MTTGLILGAELVKAKVDIFPAVGHAGIHDTTIPQPRDRLACYGSAAGTSRTPDLQILITRRRASGGRALSAGSDAPVDSVLLLLIGW